MLISRSSTLRITLRGGVAVSSIAKRVLRMEILHSLLHSEPKANNKIFITENRINQITEDISFIVNGHYHLCNWQAMEQFTSGKVLILRLTDFTSNLVLQIYCELPY